MILVLTPLQLEFDGLCAAMGAPSQRDEVNGLPIHHYSSGLTISVGGHGKTQFGITTTFLIERLQPDLVICAGASGALVPWLKPLDLIAAEQTVEHDFNLRFIQRPLPSFPGARASLELLRGFENLHFGTIASGDEDIIDQTRADEIHHLTAALAVAWEGAGGARASDFHKTPFLELRVITDHCSSTSFQDFKVRLNEGMKRIGLALAKIRSP